MTQWKVCPRCSVNLVEGKGVIFSHSQAPQTTNYLASKVCQWAYAQDLREGRVSPCSRPHGCINPVFDPLAIYPNPLDEMPEIPAPREDEL